MTVYIAPPDAPQEEFFAWLEELPELALDIETVEGIVIGIGLGNDEIAGYFTGRDCLQVLPYIVDIQAKHPIVMHNGGSDVRGLRKSFPDWHLPMIRVWDTMVAASLFNEPELNLDYQAKTHTDMPIAHGSFKTLTKEYKAKDLEGVPEPIVAEYNLSQVVATYKLKLYYDRKIDEIPRMRVIFNIEMQILPLLTQMEENGILIDAPRLAALRERLDLEATTYQEVVTQLTHGGITNVNSPNQVREWIFDVLQHPVIYRTPKGEPSTDERVLKKIAAGRHGDEPRYKFLRPLLHTRQTRKLVGTYCDGLAASLDADSRSHTQFSQVTADTGRLASREPNHQNIPKRRGPEIRRCFVAPAGSVLVAADMDQLELRIIAEEANETKMQLVFLSGGDIHQQVADELNLDRFPAKILNYTIVYMAGPQQIADQIGVSRKKAEAWQNSYFRKYYKLTAWMKEYGAFAISRGYTETWLGRRRDLSPFVGARDPMEAQRKAVNTRIQGTAAEIMKLNMLKVEDALRSSGLRSRQLIQIHDEVLLEVPLEELDTVKELLMTEMSTHHKGMPLPCTIKVGANWGDVK